MKISYIVPVYNGQAFIRRCLDSILSQRFEDVEVIFVDDGSVDGSAKILREVSSTYTCCHSFFQRNLGCGAARNAAIRKAKGEFLAILDVDDIALGERSRLQYEVALDRNADLVVGGSKIVDLSRNQLGAYSPPTQPNKLYQELLRRKASFHHSSCLMRRSKVASFGGYCERLRQGEDADIVFRFFETGSVAAVSDVVVEHTRHEASLSNGANIEESLFSGVFVTACHLLRTNTNVDITKLEDPYFNNALQCSRKWFADGSAIKDFRFKQELKRSRKQSAFKVLRKALLNPLPSVVAALMKIRGDLSPHELATYLVNAGVLPDLSPGEAPSRWTVMYPQ